MKQAKQKQAQSSQAAAAAAGSQPEPRFALAGDDAVVPFTVAALDTRGRAVQCGAALDRLISRHHYPEPVAALLAEAVVLTALLGSALKFAGKFSLQAQTDGIVTLLVCDYTAPQSAGEPAGLRAYARFDEQKLAQREAEKGGVSAPMLGKGSLAFTLDQGAQTQLYQGIVELNGGTLEDAAHRYFAQSEQIPTKIRLSSAVLSTRMADGAVRTMRRGGGVLAQYLPQSSAAEKSSAEEAADKWRVTEILTATVEAAELTDPQLPIEQLLYRLFHQQGVRVFSPQPLADKCTCSREKLFHILADFSAAERAASLENGKIRAKCQFCSAVYEFSPEDFVPSEKAV